MLDKSKYREINRAPSITMYVVEDAPDILITVPSKGTKDTVATAREYVEFLYAYVAATRQACSAVVIMDNLLSQDPEARRIYQNIDKARVYAAGLVVASPLARALGSFFIGLTRPIAPTKLFNTVDNAVEWLKTMRPQRTEN
jgi:hypothetical protein